MKMGNTRWAKTPIFWCEWVDDAKQLSLTGPNPLTNLGSHEAAFTSFLWWSKYMAPLSFGPFRIVQARLR